MLKLAIFTGLLVWGSALHAAEGGACGPMPPLYKDYQTLRAQACDGKIEEVEKYFDKHQRDYEARSIDDRLLIAPYTALALPFPSEFFKAWLTRYPNSYSAHVAAARHEYQLGWQARGEKWARDTSKEQLAAMDRHFTQAKNYLERSLKLAKMPSASYDVLIQIGKHYGRTCDKRPTPLTPNPCLRALLDRALEIDPKAYWARRYYLDALQPRWGGSFPAMDLFANKTQRAGLPDWQAKRFRAMVLEEKATVEERPEEKLRLATQAYELNWSSVNLYQIIIALAKLERYKELVPYANEYLEMHPRHDWVLMQRGVAFWLLNRHPEAYVDFLASAKMGNDFSQNKVGYFLWTGQGVPQNRAEAVVWWQKAAAGGDKHAIRNLQEAKAHGLVK